MTILLQKYHGFFGKTMVNCKIFAVEDFAEYGRQNTCIYYWT